MFPTVMMRLRQESRLCAICATCPRRTVLIALANILNKLNVSTRAAAVAQAARGGLLNQFRTMARLGHTASAYKMTPTVDAVSTSPTLNSGTYDVVQEKTSEKGKNEIENC
jgi:hypothetical protein